MRREGISLLCNFLISFCFLYLEEETKETSIEAGGDVYYSAVTPVVVVVIKPKEKESDCTIIELINGTPKRYFVGVLTV